MNWILIAAMVPAVIVMLVGRKKMQGGTPWGKPVTVVAGLVVIALALVQVVLSTGGGAAERGPMTRTLLAYHKVAGEKLGQHLSAENDLAKALVVSDIEDSAGSKVNNRLKGFRKGFDGDVIDVVNPTISERERGRAEKRWEQYKQQNPGAGGGGVDGFDIKSIPSHLWLTAAKMDRIVKNRQNECDVVVSLIGIPENVKEMQTLTDNQNVKLAGYAERTSLEYGNTYRNLLEMMRSGKIAAVVTDLPTAEEDIDYENPQMPPDDLDTAFSKKFELMTGGGM